MVHRTYQGLGSGDDAVREFDGLAPYVTEMLALQQECTRLDAGYMAMGIALDALQTAAYHFTRRRYFYHPLESAARERPAGNNRLSDLQQAIAAFEALTPYADHLRRLQGRCRPFGGDYMALDIARQGLESAAFHFTRQASFYGAKCDSAGRVRPSF